MLAHGTDGKAQMKQELERRYPDCKIEFMEVEKNNGLKRKGWIGYNKLDRYFKVL